jgi:cysteine desulfurase
VPSAAATSSAHSSIRFSIGRFTTEEEVDFADPSPAGQGRQAAAMSPLWEMVQAGIDLTPVQWAAH